MNVQSNTDRNSKDFEAISYGCLVGTLETWSVTDILMWLHQSYRTAMLRIGVGLDAAVVFFKDGMLYRAEWGNLSGEQAVVALFSLTQGTFAIIQRELPCPNPNIRLATPELLIQCAVAHDEMRRNNALRANA